MTQMESFPDLGQRVRTHLCYAQVFRDAFTQSELVARCDPANPNLVERELTLLRAEGAIERVGDYWFLRGHSVPDWSTVKGTRERLTRDILDVNRSLLGFLMRLPMVRMLAVSGSLARGHAVVDPKKPLDLDLFVVTSTSGVHVLRFIVKATNTIHLLLAALRLTSKRPLPCLNYTTESTFLEITNRSFFTASGALHVRVLKGKPEYQRFLAANSWITRYYPAESDAPVPWESGKDSRRLGHTALNLVCFAILAALSWVRNRGAGRPFPYSIQFRWDKKHCLRRGTGFSGGGYQPQVARRFREIYRSHFGAEEQLWEFLFPDTTDAGVRVNGTNAPSTGTLPLGYDA